MTKSDDKPGQLLHFQLHPTPGQTNIIYPQRQYYYELIIKKKNNLLERNIQL